MKLAAHTQDATCASCHAKIDPLGLAFDHYDAIGRWRTVEVVADGIGAESAGRCQWAAPGWAELRGLDRIQEASLDSAGAVRPGVHGEVGGLRDAPDDDL